MLQKNNILIYKSKKAGLKQFISFWSKRYDWSNERVYKKFIRNKDIKSALLWKNNLVGKKLSKNNQRIAKKFRQDVAYLKSFQKGSIKFPEILEKISCTKGLIYKVLFLHIYRPIDYPMIDQHTFRAYSYLISGVKKEIEKKRISEDYPKYRDFVLNISKKTGFDIRRIDQALMTFGKFIKENKIYC